MAKLILLNKPYGVMSQFSSSEEGETLASYISIDNVYPAGRLDKDSEGLLLLTDDGALQHKISHPHQKVVKCYWVQVEGIPDTSALQNLREGVLLKDGMTLPAEAEQIETPSIWPRHPPIRHRANIPTSWIEIKIREGRNRQVRRMTAAVGHPTLRLIRYSIGEWTIDDIKPGKSQELDVCAPKDKAHNNKPKRLSTRKHHRKKHEPKN